MPRIYSIHFGCRANQADAAALEAELLRRGFQPAETAAGADLLLLNSCTVTGAADADLRQACRRLHRNNPAAGILVTGCYAQRCPEEIAQLPGVRWVVGNSHKWQIPDLLAELVVPSSESAGPNPGRDKEAALGGASAGAETVSSQPGWVPLGLLSPQAADIDSDLRGLGSLAPSAARILVGDIAAQRQWHAAPYFGGAVEDRTRPNLKIQDGCNNRCSFCVIPSVRGLSRSLPLREVVRQIGALADAGYREVVLSGVNLGQYGRDLAPRTSFVSLIHAVLNESAVERLRLSSVEPMDFTDKLLELMASTPRIAAHVHAPLQSGSDRVLRRMHRKYTAARYCARMQAAVERLPDAAFGADVIVGFPGETDADFEQTRALIESLPFNYLHVFAFSRRPGTPAGRMGNPVNGAVVSERSRILRALAQQKNHLFRERQLGRHTQVLTLGEQSAQGTAALSGNYLRVTIAGERLAANQWASVELTALSEGGLLARLVQEA